MSKIYTEFPEALPPWYDQNSKILILGSFPSIKSLSCGCYYGHPSNRFWKILADIFHEDIPVAPEARKAFALSRGIALTDALSACSRQNSADDFKEVEPNVKIISEILEKSNIQKIFTNGKAAGGFFEKYLKEVVVEIKPNIIYKNLPSTSSRNVIGYDTLLSMWNIIR